MKNYLSLVIATLILTICQLSVTGQTGSDASDLIAIGQRDSLYSEVLQEPRELWIYAPPGASSTSGSSTTYPVMVLLDGDAHFHSVTGMIKQLSTVNGNTVCPQMIVVGIPNTDRTRDLTPTHVESSAPGGNAVSTSGGGDVFLDFIEQEVLPYIEDRYKASTYRTFVGHSLGGLTVIHALVNRPQLFDNYIAIDPSIWWDDQIVLNQAESLSSIDIWNGKALYVGVANTMAEGMNVSDVVNEESEATRHIRSILQFAKSTEEKASDDFAFDWKYYDDDSHGSVPLITEYDALRFLFSWYEFKDLYKFYDDESTATLSALKQLLKAHYKNVSEHMGHKVTPDESLINSLGYMYIRRNEADKSYAFFKMNIKNYPESANVYDSMGDYYLSQVDTINAMKQFSKAVKVGDLPYSKEKLKQLKSAN